MAILLTFSKKSKTCEKGTLLDWNASIKPRSFPSVPVQTFSYFQTPTNLDGLVAETGPSSNISQISFLANPNNPTNQYCFCNSHLQLTMPTSNLPSNSPENRKKNIFEEDYAMTAEEGFSNDTFNRDSSFSIFEESSSIEAIRATLTISDPIGTSPSEESNEETIQPGQLHHENRARTAATLSSFSTVTLPPAHLFYTNATSFATGRQDMQPPQLGPNQEMSLLELCKYARYSSSVPGTRSTGGASRRNTHRPFSERLSNVLTLLDQIEQDIQASP